RVMRGIASIAKLVTPAPASAFVVSPEVRGARCPISTWPLRRRPISSVLVTATCRTTSAPQAASAPPTSAPASLYSESGCPAPSPAPDSSATSRSDLRSEATMSGTSATRRSPSAVSLGTPILIGESRAAYAIRSARGSGRGLGARQGGEPVEGVQPLAGVELHRRDDQPRHADLAVALDPLRNLFLRADQRGRLGDLVGDRLVGRLAVAVQVEALDLVGNVAEPEPVREVDVEVGLAAAHAAEVEEQAGL